MNQLTNSKTISSREIALLTGKKHKNLLRDIRNMEVAWKKIAGCKFELTSYIDKSNRQQPMYKLTKRECLYIGTKFNDEERAKLVLRWEELEIEKQKPLTPAEQLLQNAQLLVQQEKRMNAIENEVKKIKAQVTVRSNYFTIVGYATLQGISCGLKLASSLGRKASAICKKEGIETETIPDPRFGKIRTYPETILQQVFQNNLV